MSADKAFVHDTRVSPRTSTWRGSAEAVAQPDEITGDTLLNSQCREQHNFSLSLQRMIRRPTGASPSPS